MIRVNAQLAQQGTRRRRVMEEHPDGNRKSLGFREVPFVEELSRRLHEAHLLAE